MLKSLIKKELLQLNQFYFYNAKTKTLKSRKARIKTIIGFCVLFVFLAASLGMMCLGLSTGLVGYGHDWLYFSITGLLAVVVGVIVDAFSTYNLLYKSKDNDLLLSMPIDPSKLVFARALGVYVMGMFYESLIFIPAMIVYWIIAPVTVLNVVIPILIWIVMGFFVTVLTCLLGWVIAWISTKITNKAVTKTLLTIAFLAVYYVVYFKMISALNNIIMYADQLMEVVSGWLFLAYHMGLACCGDIVSFLIYLAIVGALTAVTYYLLSRTYIKMVTSEKSAKKVEYHKTASRKNSVYVALVKKEMSRLVGNSTYLLNSCLGLLICVGLSVFMFIKMSDIRQILPLLESLPDDLAWVSSMVPAALAIIPMFLLSMNTPSAPSVSLEGKYIWVLQSSPVGADKILTAKVLFGFVLCFIPTLILSLSLVIIFKVGLLSGFLIVLANILYMCFTDIAGVFFDVHKANINWTNEVYPVKQGFSVTCIILGGWAITIVLAGLFFLLRKVVSANLYIAFVDLILVVGSALMFRNIRTKGAAKFAYLN